MAQPSGGWGGAAAVTAALALVGSLGASALFYYIYLPHYRRDSVDWLCRVEESRFILASLHPTKFMRMGARGRIRD